MLPALTSGHIAGIIVTLCAVTLVGIYAGRMVKSALDFSVGGRRAGPTVVAGNNMETFCRRLSTIGTAQLLSNTACAPGGSPCAGWPAPSLTWSGPRLHESALETRPNIWSVSTERIGRLASIFLPQD